MALYKARHRLHLFPYFYTCVLTRLSFDYNTMYFNRGRDSSVGIATRYWPDGPGIESRWAARFSHTSRLALGPPASRTMGTRSFLGVKRPRCGVDNPPSSSAEVEGKVELYICSPSGPSWPVIG